MSTPNIAPLLSGQVIGSTSDSFVIAEWRDAGGPAGPPRLIAPLHLHRQDDEAWYVLEGALRLQVAKQEVEARAGSAVFVPRGTPHTFWNPGPDPVRYLLVMTSNIYHMSLLKNSVLNTISFAVTIPCRANQRGGRYTEDDGRAATD